MIDLFEKAKEYGVVIRDHEVVFSGVKFIKEEDGTVQILSTCRDFYVPLKQKYIDSMLLDGFVHGMKMYLTDKYDKAIEQITKSLQEEQAYRRNQRKINYLKTLRDETISKRNREIKRRC